MSCRDENEVTSYPTGDVQLDAEISKWIVWDKVNLELFNFIALHNTTFIDLQEIKRQLENDRLNLD